MKKTLSVFLLIISCFTFLLSINIAYSTKKTFASQILFSDNFGIGDTHQWEVIRGNWVFQNQKYGTEINTDFTLAETQAGDYLWTDYNFEVDLTVNAGEDRNLFFRVNPERSIHGDGTHVWDWPTGYGLHITSNRIYLDKFFQTSAITLSYGNFDFPVETTHSLKVNLLGTLIKVYADNNLIINFTDSSANPYLQGRIALAASTGTVYPTKVWFDNVLVTTTDYLPTPIPTSSPSPVPTPISTPIPSPKPVIVLPGLGASWNANALLNCKLESNDNEWTLAPYATDFYKPLIEALGEKHRFFNYDWRKDVRSHAPALQDFILGLGEGKVNLVGHSMGGLVGRAYLEQTKEKNQLNKLLTVGSPHEGAVQAYPAWAGGDLWEDNFLQKIAMTIVLKRCGGLFGNDKETIQTVVPSLQNLLPTFDYLRNKKTNSLKSYDDMNIQNNWLPNSLLSSFYGVAFGTLSGNNNETLKEITTKEPSRGDIKAGRWLDGKPVDKVKINEGDGTVLLSSSHLTGATSFEINQNHVGLVTSSEGINQILNFFDPRITVNIPSFAEPTSALILISYPSNFWIVNQNKIIKDNSGVISFMNPGGNKYKFGLLSKKEDTLFIVAQFLKDGRVFWKEYHLKNRLPKFGLVDFDPENPKEDS